MLYCFQKLTKPKFPPLFTHPHTHYFPLAFIFNSLHSAMQDIFGSVRRSLVLRSPDDDSTTVGTLVDKIKCIRKSRMFSKLSPPPQSVNSPTAPTIRWRKGEMIGCGAFGQVYMGMNLDSGELLAVKQVISLFQLIGSAPENFVNLSRLLICRKMWIYRDCSICLDVFVFRFW